jgi:predicted deacylase
MPRSLKKTLLGMAIDADIVLDLHCDNEAVLHLRTARRWPTPSRRWRRCSARTRLLAVQAGGEPFDEACSRLWWDLAAHFGPRRRFRRPACRPRSNCAAKWTCATTGAKGCRTACCSS